MYKKFYIFLIIMLVASLVTSISYIMINYKEDKKQNEVFEKLENIITESNEEKKEQKKETINFKIQKII